MALLADYHTHTVYSHGKGTIEENVQAACDKGLVQIGITDHGFNHKLFPVTRQELLKQREEIETLKEKYPIEILLGVEANIISPRGEVDIVADDYKNLDVLIVGYHKVVKRPKKKDFWFAFSNLLATWFKHTGKHQIKRNTAAYLNAMKNYDIDIISHLNKDCRVNVAEVAKVAAETSTLIELNSKCLSLTDEEIKTCYNAGCKFILSSDAHSPSRVGDCSKGLQAALRLRLPESVIVNYNSLPVFKKFKKGKKNVKAK